MNDERNIEASSNDRATSPAREAAEAVAKEALEAEKLRDLKEKIIKESVGTIGHAYRIQRVKKFKPNAKSSADFELVEERHGPFAAIVISAHFPEEWAGKVSAITLSALVFHDGGSRVERLGAENSRANENDFWSFEPRPQG